MTLQQIGLIVMALFVLIAVVATIVDGEKPRRKQNVRLPRRTAWDIASKYYGAGRE